MFRFAHDVDSAEERFAVALTEFSKLALAPRRAPPHGPPLDDRQRELIALAHRALWFGVELRLGDRERSARGFAAAEMLHGDARAALRREIAFAREKHLLDVAFDIELGPTPLDRSEARLAEVAQAWREAAHELTLPTFARWLGEPAVLRELVELYGDLLRVVRVSSLPLRPDGPDPAYLRSLLTLARTGESGAAPRGSVERDLSPELREQFRQDATRTAKLSALLARVEDSAERPLEAADVLRLRTAAIARASDSVPPDGKVSALSIDRAPAVGPRTESAAFVPSGQQLNHGDDDPEPASGAVEDVVDAPAPIASSLPVVAMFGAERGAASLLRIGVALAALGLLAMLAVALLPISFWWDREPTAQPIGDGRGGVVPSARE